MGKRADARLFHIASWQAGGWTILCYSKNSLIGVFLDSSPPYGGGDTEGVR